MVDRSRPSSEAAGLRDLPVDLLSSATPTEILALAARSLISAGADRATSHRVSPDSGLNLVSHDGFGPDLVDQLAGLPPSETPFGTAAATREPVLVADLTTDPVFGGSGVGDVLLGAGCRACLCYPLLDGRRTPLGVVSAHWDREIPADAEPLRLVAAEAARRLTHAVGNPEGRSPADLAAEVTHLRRALTTRTLIAQAQGIIMAREGVDDRAAFNVLRLASQRTNRKLYDIAADVVSRVADRRS